MFEKELLKYKITGCFIFAPNEELRLKCNAPTSTDCGGIYCIYDMTDGKDDLLYIGSSGQRDKNREFKGRKSGLGGMKDRIVNGYHPKLEHDENSKRIKRHKAFPLLMKSEGIKQVRICWYITYDGKDYFDFPTDVEKALLEDYRVYHNRKPQWHK